MPSLPPGAIALPPNTLAVLSAVLAGATTVTEVATAAALSRSSAYDAINRLADEGLVTFTPRAQGTLRPAVTLIR